MAARDRLYAAVALAGVVGGAGAAATACGLPLGGLGAASDAGTSDASVSGDDTSSSADGDLEADVPSACTTVDAACLGTLPPGWQPVTVTDGGCSQHFDAATLVVNPRVDDGGCACGACQLVGSFSCSGPVVVTSGDGCNDSPNFIDAALPGACTTPPQGAQHVEAHAPTATGTVGCFVPNDAGAGVTTDTLTLCLPGCSADYCGASPRCVLSEGNVPCPAGFTLLTQAGTGADPGCPACPCDAGAPGPCEGTVTVFGASACGDGGGEATYPLGTCNQFSTSNDFESLFIDLVPPEASCSASTTTSGPADASLSGVRTICCR